MRTGTRPTSASSRRSPRRWATWLRSCCGLALRAARLRDGGHLPL